MNRIAGLCSFLIFAFALTAYAQGPSAKSDVPNLSAPGWKLLGSQPMVLPISDGNVNVAVKAVVNIYENKSANLLANVLLWKDSEVAMIYGDPNDDGSGVTMALKVNGTWYPAKNKGLQQLRATLVKGFDDDPIGFKLILETVDGFKELVLNF